MTTLIIITIISFVFGIDITKAIMGFIKRAKGEKEENNSK